MSDYTLILDARTNFECIYTANISRAELSSRKQIIAEAKIFIILLMNFSTNVEVINQIDIIARSPFHKIYAYVHKKFLDRLPKNHALEKQEERYA